LNTKTYSFKREQLHTLSSIFAVGTGGFSFSYEGDYFKTFDHWDTYLKITAEVPRFVSNFHGLGNETNRDIDFLGRDFYRVQRTLVGFYPALKKRGDGGTTLSIGPALEGIKIEENFDRIVIDEYQPLDVNPEVYNFRMFAGGHASFDYFNSDHLAIPTQGLGFNVSAVYRANLDDLKRQNVNLSSEFKFYVRLGVSDRFVLASRIGVQHIIGKYDFFQANNLGGINNLRSFANERFSGRTAFYQNIDVRIKVFDSENQSVPISGGITPGFDYGRVWIDEETSDKMHYGYGGSIWVAPLDYIALSAGMFFSEEEPRFTVRAGFQF